MAGMTEEPGTDAEAMSGDNQNCSPDGSDITGRYLKASRQCWMGAWVHLLGYCKKGWHKKAGGSNASWMTVVWFLCFCDYFCYLPENIVYRSYFLFAMTCIFSFFSFMHKVHLLDSPQYGNSWCKKMWSDYCGVIILSQGRLLMSLVGVTFLISGTHSWPGVRPSRKMSPEIVGDWCCRGNKTCRVRECWLGWLGQLFPWKLRIGW